MGVVRRFFSRIRESQPWRSVFRGDWPRTRAEGIRTVLANFFLHLHPPTIRPHALKLRYTWCMGGICFFLFLVEVITGIFLMFYYHPSIELVYADMQELASAVAFGRVMRNLHRWAGHAMVIAVWLHMLRVFLTGSYKKPKEFNWVIGVGLLTGTMFLAFTGYLLPWDQLSMWAVTVGSKMAGAVPFLGAEGPGAGWLDLGGYELISSSSDARYLLLGSSAVGPAALLRFYVLHCIAVPFVVTVLCAVHFWRVRRDGGISGPL